MARTAGSVNRSSIPLIKIVKEKSTCYDIPKVINKPDDAASIIHDIIGDSDRENFVVLCLDQKNKVVSAEIVSIGTINQCLVHPREVFKAAMLSNAVSIVIAHNHPSGELTPSTEDKTLTGRLLDAGEILGIKVLDHVIVGGDKDKFTSLRETTGLWSAKPFHC